ncbi:DUF2752 domain-containing protein [Micromonospora ureilytica]|uniref:DUF2752 domain-containing protein n=1 Tax=Micromonospora ureilytica TaxID=709868 RepID=A0ABS0JKU2_9ACTN|nr:DUF2752 domain-containing protein [Micromonospora ureilytica]MBG6067297.1 hypothetical protein [Micromonospora ureilytica]WSR59228.1 DUF2752 domain-containing protein [Micromonospora ureilytica]
MTSVPGPVNQPQPAPGAVHTAPPDGFGPDGFGTGGASPHGFDPHGFGPGGSGPEGWPTTPPAGYAAPEPDRLTRFVLRLYERSPRWAVPLAALGCVGIGMSYAMLSNPTHADPDAAPTCLLKLTTGLDCPGCGGTRALWYVLHGDLPAAARHHFLFIFALPFLAYLFVAWAGSQAFGWRMPELRISSKAIGGFLAAWLAFSVLRNLPWAPFTSLYV